MANVVTTAESNLITAEKMKRVREVDFVQQFTHNSLDKLLEVLGVTRKIPMMEGTTMYVYYRRHRNNLHRCGRLNLFFVGGYNMAYNFAKLADAELLDSVPENANAFVEVEGTVKRVPGSGLGGDSGIPTAILKLNTDSGDTSSVQSLLSGGVATVATGDNTRATAATIYTATCDNMTYDEVKEIFLAGGSVNARLHVMQDVGSQGALCFDSCSIEGGYFNTSGVEMIAFYFISVLNSYSGTTFCWFPDGTITTDMSVLEGG